MILVWRRHSSTLASSSPANWLHLRKESRPHQRFESVRPRPLMEERVTPTKQHPRILKRDWMEGLRVGVSNPLWKQTWPQNGRTGVAAAGAVEVLSLLLPLFHCCCSCRCRNGLLATHRPTAYRSRASPVKCHRFQESSGLIRELPRHPFRQALTPLFTLYSWIIHRRHFA